MKILQNALVAAQALVALTFLAALSPHPVQAQEKTSNSVLTIMPMGGADPQRLQIGPVTSGSKHAGWQLLEAADYCLASAPPIDADAPLLIVGVGKASGLGLFGIAHNDFPRSINLFEDTRIAARFDGGTAFEGFANAVLRGTDPVPVLVPSFWIAEQQFSDPASVVAGLSLQDLLERGALRMSDALRAPFTPADFFRPFQLGSKVSVETSVPGDNGRMVLFEGTYSLSGSSKTFRSLLACAK